MTPRQAVERSDGLRLRRRERQWIAAGSTPPARRLRAEICASELVEPRLFSARSIEHVLPQNPADDSHWVSDFTGEERAELVNTVGNLVLLSKSKNSSASRKDFGEKKVTYLAPRVSDFPRSHQVIQAAQWTPEVIRRRTDDFVAKVMERP